MPTIDFDAFLAEQKQEPVLLKLGGKVFSLAASLPAPLALHLLVLNKHRSTVTEVPADEVETVARGLLGNDYDEIVGLVGGFDQVAALLTQLLGIYTPEDPAGGPKAPKPKRRKGSR